MAQELPDIPDWRVSRLPGKKVFMSLSGCVQLDERRSKHSFFQPGGGAAVSACTRSFALTISLAFGPGS